MLPFGKFLIVFTILIAVKIKESIQGKFERALLDDLLMEYNPMERPVSNESDPLEVTFGITLQQIIDVDEKNQIVVTNAWLDMEWVDYNLRWNISDYGGVMDLRFNPNRLWKPDILMYNSADEKFDGTYQTNVVVKHNGTCHWVPPGIFKSTCKIDITWFPFDDQNCVMKFGSWTYNGFQVDLVLKSDSGDTTDFISNGEWDLLGLPGKRNGIVYACCPEPYVDITFTMKIRRRTLYYFFNLIVPCVLISSMALLGFTLPPDCGEKLTLGTYFNCIMFMVASSVVLTLVVLNYHHRTADIHTMGPWTKCLFLLWLPWILGMQRPGRDISFKAIKSRFTDRKGMELRERSSRSLLANVLDIDDDFRASVLSHRTFNCGASTSSPASEARSICNYSARELQLILHEVRYITDYMKKQQDDQEVINDWKYAAMVVDRFCLLVFTFFTIVATVAVLYSAPHIIVD
ncbi:acetylcholine receptor subunit alpha-type acr-16 isoform X3 [Daktulosphaira vitifoliae]|uniref:acetylcholine receptor subunit alpha-type acr-16 isoform X3 n=1 Tax=Daktulosphaira vitifoliae TaxID=58002 RepID=UPI0021A9920F|nr:acetylcholine receptor subunit alpha-type acr-16 isoform X3 [Daktulosphaira vitifoliae]